MFNLPKSHLLGDYRLKLNKVSPGKGANEANSEIVSSGPHNLSRDVPRRDNLTNHRGWTFCDEACAGQRDVNNSALKAAAVLADDNCGTFGGKPLCATFFDETKFVAIGQPYQFVGEFVPLVLGDLKTQGKPVLCVSHCVAHNTAQFIKIDNELGVQFRLGWRFNQGAATRYIDGDEGMFLSPVVQKAPV